MTDNYYFKYLKYKQKYSQLKQLIGAGKVEDLKNIEKVLQQLGITENTGIDIHQISNEIYQNLNGREININTIFQILNEIKFYDKSLPKLTSEPIATSPVENTKAAASPVVNTKASNPSLVESELSVENIKKLILGRTLTVDNFIQNLPQNDDSVYLLERLHDHDDKYYRKTYYDINNSDILIYKHLIDKVDNTVILLPIIKDFVGNKSEILKEIVEKLLSKQIIFLTKKEFQYDFRNTRNKYLKYKNY